MKCIVTLCLVFAVANQETCEQPHFVDWALWEHGCVAERNVCIDQVGTTREQTSPSMLLSAVASTWKCPNLGCTAVLWVAQPALSGQVCIVLGYSVHTGLAAACGWLVPSVQSMQHHQHLALKPQV